MSWRQRTAEVETASSQRSGRVPTGLVTIALTATATMFIWLAWNVLGAYLESAASLSRDLVRLETLTTTITGLDRRLTSLTQTMVARGDLSERPAYRALGPQLNTAIMQVEEIAGRVELFGVAWQIVQANTALGNLEADMFDLIRRGQLDEARVLLAGADYAGHRAAYSKGMSALIARLQEKRLAMVRERTRGLLPIAVGAVFLVVCVVAWRQVIATMQADRRAAESALEERASERVRVAELRIAKEAAEAASLAKSQFLATVSHELRTPLTAIIGYTELLHEELGRQTRQQTATDLEAIESASRHLLDMITGVLDLSKIESGKLQLHIESFEVRPALDEVVAAVVPLMHRNRNQLEVDVRGELGEMRSDSTRLRQVLVNLLGNSAKFTVDGHVRLEATRYVEQGRPWLCFRVSDTGIGLSPQHLERILQPFAQIDTPGTQRSGGTGLGLAISQQFCTLMGGAITATSRVGAGTVFDVRLPADAPVG